MTAHETVEELTYRMYRYNRNLEPHRDYLRFVALWPADQVERMERRYQAEKVPA